METKNQICKCGHELNNHSYIPEEPDNFDLDCDNCPCKKFETKNHSPDLNIQDKCSQESRSETPIKKQNPVSTLSDKIERIWMQQLNIKKGKGKRMAFEGCSKSNIKDFIKKLEKFKWKHNGNYVIQINNFFSYLRKLAGDDLLK